MATIYGILFIIEVLQVMFKLSKKKKYFLEFLVKISSLLLKQDQEDLV